MESKLKAECMDQSGELYENMLLKEGGFPHLPNPVFVPEPKTKQAIVGLLENKSDEWTDAGTMPDHPCLCETDFPIGKAEKIYQFWNGEFFGFAHPYKGVAIEYANMKSANQNVRWREVQS